MCVQHESGINVMLYVSSELGRQRGPPVRDAGYDPVTGKSWQSQEISRTDALSADRRRHVSTTPTEDTPIEEAPIEEAPTSTLTER